MVGICVELKTSCKHCSAALMLNAYTEDILCPSCNQINNFSAETWHSLLEDAVKEAPKFKIGEGQPSTIMRGEYTYSLTYGRQEPRCGKCKTGIDVTKIDEYSSKGNVSCSKCQNVIFVRKPGEMISSSFGSVKYLVGEDDDLLSVNKTGTDVPASSKPILFTCPSCAGNLEIDGTNRMVTCKFCDSQIYLPDDLWFRLHPAKIVERWYMLLDVTAAGKPKKDYKIGDDLIEWYYLCDTAVDKKGNLYIASADSDQSAFTLWSVAPDLKLRWTRNDLKFDHEGTGLALTNDGHLYLWNSGRHSLLKLSSKDGSTIKKIDGDKDRNRINMKGCTSLVSCPDGTILTIINNTFARFRENGDRVDLWKTRKFGIFPSGKGSTIPDNDDEYAPYIKEIGSSPKRLSGGFTKMQVGHDGFIYMIDRSSSDGEVAKYDMDGKQLWSKYIPLEYKDCKACTDAKGNVYIVGRKDSNGRMVRLSAKTMHFDTVVKDIKEGGAMNDEDILAVAPDGTAYAFKYYNRLKVFLPDMKLWYRSKQAEEDDNEVLKRKQDAIEKDEEFG